MTLLSKPMFCDGDVFIVDNEFVPLIGIDTIEITDIVSGTIYTLCSIEGSLPERKSYEQSEFEAWYNRGVFAWDRNLSAKKAEEKSEYEEEQVIDSLSYSVGDITFRAEFVYVEDGVFWTRHEISLNNHGNCATLSLTEGDITPSLLREYADKLEEAEACALKKIS